VRGLGIRLRHPDGKPALVREGGREVIRAGAEVTLEVQEVEWVDPRIQIAMNSHYGKFRERPMLLYRPEQVEEIHERTKPKGSKWDSAPGFKPRRK